MTVRITHTTETNTLRLILKIAGAPSKQHWDMTMLHYLPDTVYLHWTRKDAGGWREGKAEVVGQQVVGDFITTHPTTRITEGFERTDPKPEWLEGLIAEHAPEGP